MFLGGSVWGNSAEHAEDFPLHLRTHRPEGKKYPFFIFVGK